MTVRIAKKTDRDHDDPAADLTLNYNYRNIQNCNCREDRNLSIIAHLRAERLALRSNSVHLAEAHDRALAATSRAKAMLRLTVQMAANAVNDELDHIPSAQAIARACLLKDDIDSTCTTIEQYLDDLVFQPLQLLAREAGDR